MQKRLYRTLSAAFVVILEVTVNKQQNNEQLVGVHYERLISDKVAANAQYLTHFLPSVLTYNFVSCWPELTLLRARLRHRPPLIYTEHEQGIMVSVHWRVIFVPCLGWFCSDTSLLNSWI